MTGILPDHIPAVTPRWPVLDPHDPVVLMIAEIGRKRQLEYDRNDLARALETLLHEDLETERDIAIGSDRTQEQYGYEARKFREWCERMHVSWQPGHPEGVSYYLLVRRAEGASYETLKHIRAAIRWYYKVKDQSFSCDDAMIRAALRFCRRHYKNSKGRGPTPPDTQPDAAPTKDLEHA